MKNWFLVGCVLVLGTLTGAEVILSSVGDVPIAPGEGSSFDFRNGPTIQSVKPESFGCGLLGGLKIRDAVPDSDEVIVIGDVVSVNMIGVTGLDEAARYHKTFEPTGWYRIGIRVRKEIKGCMGVRNFSFPAANNRILACIDGWWPYYRGMTLKIGLKRTDGKWVVSHKVPVLPYSPYSSDRIRISSSDRDLQWELGDDGIFPYAAISNAVALASQKLFVRFDNHTVVAFASGRAMISGDFGDFYDFGMTSRIHVWCDPKKGNPLYWKNMWLTDSIPCDSDYVVLHEWQAGKGN